MLRISSLVVVVADGAAPWKAVSPKAINAPDSDVDGPSLLVPASETDNDSPLAALATAAAADGGPAEAVFRLSGGQTRAAAAAATSSSPHRTGRMLNAAAGEAGAAAANRKRAAEAAPDGAEAPAEKKAARTGGQPGVPPAGTARNGESGRTQKCTGCLETKPLDAFYKVTVQA